MMASTRAVFLASLTLEAAFDVRGVTACASNQHLIGCRAANIIPGVTIIPSGTWGVNRAQEASQLSRRLWSAPWSAYLTGNGGPVAAPGRAAYRRNPNVNQGPIVQSAPVLLEPVSRGRVLPSKSWST
jgi:hypothetical protein